MLPRLKPAEFQEFINSKPYGVILLDANWNGSGRQLLPRFEDAISRFGDQVAYGEIDTDEALELAMELNLMNVPALAFYRCGKLVECYIGASQDVVRQSELLVAGAQILCLSVETSPLIQSPTESKQDKNWFSRFWHWLFAP